MPSLLCFTFADETLSYIEVSLNEEIIPPTHKNFILKNSLELVLKSVEQEICILHSRNVVYPWSFVGDHESLHEKFLKIRPCRPCLYTCELVIYLLHSISLFFCVIP